MEVKTLAQLSKIADVCRKKGIESIKITPEAVEFTLKDALPTRKRTKKADPLDNTPGSIENQSEPSFEDLLFYSSPGGSEQTPGHE